MPLTVVALILCVAVAAVAALYVGLTTGPDWLALVIATGPPAALAWLLLRGRLPGRHQALMAAIVAAAALALVVWSAYSYST